MTKRLLAIYLILVFLLAAFVPSCNPGGGATYSLTMAVSPLGSGTAQDVTGGSPYAENTSVNIQATAHDSYTFVKWTSSDGGAFVNPNLAATTFTMPAQNVTATAHFVGPLDHFKCYNVTDAPYVGKNVALEDEFGSINVTVGHAMLFANPTQKVYGETVTNISNPDHHLTFYTIFYEETPRTWYVEVHNQFGTYNLTVQGPVMLAVPTQKVDPGSHEPPLSLDHFLVYQVINGSVLEAGVNLTDEFGNDTCVVGEPWLFATPVQKTVGTFVTPIAHPDEHLVFYKISNCETPSPTHVTVVNQLYAGNQTLYLGGDKATLLGVPSQKVEFGEQIEHFTCYPLAEGSAVGTSVHLKDQFVDLNATVGPAFYFCNPAAKQVGEELSPILDPDYHLTIYWLGDVKYQGWHVYVQNQFGVQELYMYGPVALAVPTQKVWPGNHTAPVGLDHYLLYQVIGGISLGGIPAYLTDEFVSNDNVGMLEPYYFANPVQKTVDGKTTPIENSMAHLVFYHIAGDLFGYPEGVLVSNQFVVEQPYYLHDRSNMLAVPSLKMMYEPWFPE